MIIINKKHSETALAIIYLHRCSSLSGQCLLLIESYCILYILILISLFFLNFVKFVVQ